MSMNIKGENKIHSQSSVSTICQNCKQNFLILPEDFSFYEKIKVPSPTFCPDCRLVRRMIWRNERTLYKRSCSKTGRQIIAMFSPNADLVVYDHDVWWGDQWDPTDYGRNYDFSRPFFEQFKELLKVTPLANLGNSNCPGSPYGNHNADCKDCYLSYASYNNERTHYSYGAVELKDCIDIYAGSKSEFCYGFTLCSGLYKTHFSYDTDESINSFFLKHCKNLQDCTGCVNLRNKSYCIFNVQYTREEYEKKKKELDFGSFKKFSEFERKFEEFSLNFPSKHANIIKSQMVSGDNIINAKNVKDSFDIYGDVEDSKYLIHIWQMKDSYDVYGGGAVASLIYEGVDAGKQSSNQLFSVLTHSCLDTHYTYMCFSNKNLFGCVGLRGKQYCILNKQYSKEEYLNLVPKIIQHMKDMPYINREGLVYRYGEFFPSDLSPFAYNETIAQEYFPKTKEKIIGRGYSFKVPLEKDHKITIYSADLPDHIKDIPGSIINEVIACPNDGSELTQCTKAYKIIKAELDFLKNNNIALPRYCPNCRHYKRLKQRNPFHLWHGKCQCAGQTSLNQKYNNTANHTHGSLVCPNEFETSYSPDKQDIIYCEKCYQQEVY